MNEKLILKEDVSGSMTLSEVMLPIIEQLSRDKKFSAVRTYSCVLRSFTKFVAEVSEETLSVTGIQEADAPFVSCLMVGEVFQAGRLKEYEGWMRGRKLSWNTVSTYMRTLHAVYNRLVAPGTMGHNPKLFDDVYTKVESRTKRALTNEQMHTLLSADINTLPEPLQCVLAYFLLTFFFRGMPFIDLAHLQKRDVKGDTITYCRHKTGCQITLRIPREAQALLKKCRSANSDSIYLFPILNAEKGQDENLKKDEETLYNRYLRALRNYNKQLTKVAALLLPDAKLSSYTPRHTWATLAFYRGTSVGIISKALGHSSSKVTEIYLKPFEDEKVDAANDELIAMLMKDSKVMSFYR